MIGFRFCLVVVLVLLHCHIVHPRNTAKRRLDSFTDASATPNLEALALREAEVLLAQKEYGRNIHLFKRLKEEGYSIHGFYHTSTWQEYWKEVISEQLYLLDGRRKFPHIKNADIDAFKGNQNLDHATYEWDTRGRYTSLLDITEELYLNVAGRDLKEFQDVKALASYLLLDHIEKIKFNFNYSLIREVYDEAVPLEKEKYEQDLELSSGEYPTILKLKQHCDAMKKQGKKSLVYYFHAKGPCCWKDYKQIYSDNLVYQDKSHRNNQIKFSPVSTWRDLMNSAVLEFPSICIRALIDKNYSACGAENQLAHYSGNFWWAHCDHIAQLDFPPNRFDWRKPEFFVLFVHRKLDVRERFGFRCGYSVYNCGVHFYKHECPRSRYRQTLWNNVLNDTIGRSTGKGASADDNMSNCAHLRSKNQTLLELQSDLLHYFGK
jgi:hypothetical protein